MDYIPKVAVMNRGASVPLDIFVKATMVVQHGNLLTVYEPSGVREIELDAGQETRTVLYPAEFC
jgi:hypothetical protein